MEILKIDDEIRPLKFSARAGFEPWHTCLPIRRANQLRHNQVHGFGDILFLLCFTIRMCCVSHQIYQQFIYRLLIYENQIIAKYFTFFNHLLSID